LLMVSAHPTASLRLLIELAMPFGPPSAGNFVITPFWNTKGRHAVDGVFWWMPPGSALRLNVVAARYT